MADISDQRFEEMRRKVRATLNLDKRRASLGDGSGNVYVPGRPGYVYVREKQADGLGIRKEVRLWPNANIRIEPGIAILLGYDDDNELCVMQADFSGQLQQGSNPWANNPLDPAFKFVNQLQFMTLLSHSTSPLSLFVVVRAWIYIVDSTAYSVPTTLVDLTASVPSSGNHLLAGLFVKTDQTVEIKLSTAQSELDPLDLTDVQECVTGSTAGSVPCWFWRLYGGQTVVNDKPYPDGDSFLDGRNIINVDTALTVKEIDGAPSVRPVRTIRVSNGTLTDDGGGQITITTGGGGGSYTATQVVYVAKYGLDANDGLSVMAPKLTIGSAITAAGTLIGGGATWVRIEVLDGGLYTEDPSLTDFMTLTAPAATIEGMITLADRASAFVHRHFAVTTQPRCLLKNSGGNSYYTCDLMDTRGTGGALTGKDGCRNASSGAVLFVCINQLFVTQNGFGLIDAANGFGHIHFYLADLYLAGNNATGLRGQSANTNLIGYIDHILELGTPTGTVGIDISDAAAIVKLTASEIIADTAYNISAGSLYISCPKITGTETGTPVVEISNQKLYSSYASLDDTVILDAQTGALVISLANGKGIYAYVDGGATVSSFTGYNTSGIGGALGLGYVRGSLASPDYPNSGDDLGYLDFKGYDVTDAALQSGANLFAEATEDWSHTVRGSQLREYTVPNGSTTLTEGRRVLQDQRNYFLQNVIGGAVDPCTFDARLTLTSATPVLTADVTAATTLYLALYKGDRLALWDSTLSAWALITLTEKSIKLTDTQTGTLNGTTTVTALTDTSQFVVGMQITGTNIPANTTIATIASATSITMNNAATGSGASSLTFKLPPSTVYDVFCYISSSAAKLEFVAWSNSGAGTGARATALTTQNGILSKTGDVTRRYVGTIKTTTTAGQIQMVMTGATVSLLIQNFYNQVFVLNRQYDSTASWTYNTATWRQERGTAANITQFVVGVVEEKIHALYNNIISVVAGVSSGVIGMNLNSTTATPNLFGYVGVTGIAPVAATLEAYPALGYNELVPMEIAPAGTPTFFGAPYSSMSMINYRC